MLLVSMLTQSARPNIHEMGGVSYLVLKVVSNSAANLLGITLWSDTYAQTLPHFYPEQPVWKMALPAVLSPGSISEIGIYRFEPWLPLRTLVMMLTTFGLLPFCLFYFRGAGVSKLKELPMGVGIALVCGICFWLLGPLTGRSVDRLIGYGWPAFWVAVPVIAASLPKAYLINPRQAAWFWSGHLLLSWLPVVVKF
jgi:hypothetical protein